VDLASCYLLCLSSDSKPDHPYSIASKTTLIVDDAAVTLKLLASILRNEGYKVQMASPAEQALSTLRTFRPDLVLVDVHLPGIDGFRSPAESGRMLACRLRAGSQIAMSVISTATIISTPASISTRSAPGWGHVSLNTTSICAEVDLKMKAKASNLLGAGLCHKSTGRTTSNSSSSCGTSERNDVASVKLPPPQGRHLQRHIRPTPTEC